MGRRDTYYDGRGVNGHKYKVCFRADSLDCNWPNLCNDYGSNRSPTCRDIKPLSTNVGGEDLSSSSR
jgi:hypothetical protein